MNWMKKTVALLVCVLMLVSAMAGCAASGADTSADVSAVDSVAKTTDAQTETASGSTEDVAALLYEAAEGGAIELSGIISPTMADRADIDKAWPHTLATEGTVKIGWTEMSQANPWFVAVKNSAEETAEKYGFDLTFLIAENSVETQSSQVDNFITMNVDIIVIDPCDVEACAKDIERAVAAGIPVLCIGSAPSKSTNAPILTTLSDNAYEVGYAAGQYAGSTFAADEQINMACIPGQLGNTSAESRVCGIVGGIIAARQTALGVFVSDEDAKYQSYLLWEELKANGNAAIDDLKIDILAYGEGQWSEEGGLAAAEPILTAHGSELNLMVADNEFQCFGILRAISNAGLEGKIKVGTCADGTNAGLQKIIDGELLMSGSWNGDQQGSFAIEFIKAIFIDGEDPSDLPFESFFTPKTFTADNAAEWINSDPDATFFAVPDFEFPASIPELVG